LILLDTHAWIWFVSNPEKLSRPARKEIEKETGQGRLLVSAISVWETAMLVKSKRLDLSIPVEDWLARCRKLPFFAFVPIDPDIAFRSVYLPGRFHKDPADRLIAATALVKSIPLVTKDLRLRRYTHLSTIW